MDRKTGGNAVMVAAQRPGDASNSKTLTFSRRVSAPHQFAAHAFLGGAVKCPPISETRLPDVTYWQVAQEYTANGIARDIERVQGA